MSTCATCKWWGDPISLNTVRECKLISDGITDQAKALPSDTGAWLVTEPTFGCNQWTQAGQSPATDEEDENGEYQRFKRWAREAVDPPTDDER